MVKNSTTSSVRGLWTSCFMIRSPFWLFFKGSIRAWVSELNRSESRTPACNNVTRSEVECVSEKAPRPQPFTLQEVMSPHRSCDARESLWCVYRGRMAASTLRFVSPHIWWPQAFLLVLSHYYVEHAWPSSRLHVGTPPQLKTPPTDLLGLDIQNKQFFPKSWELSYCILLFLQL